MRLRLEGPDAVWLTVVGVVGDVRMYNWWDGEDFAVVYVPLRQAPPGGLVYAAVRTPAIRQRSPRRFDRQSSRSTVSLPVSAVRSMRQAVEESSGGLHHMATLMGVCGGIGLVLALVGIYSVMSYAVTQRTHEFGIRMALGATAPDVLRITLDASGRAHGTRRRARIAARARVRPPARQRALRNRLAAAAALPGDRSRAGFRIAGGRVPPRATYATGSIPPRFCAGNDTGDFACTPPRGSSPPPRCSRTSMRPYPSIRPACSSGSAAWPAIEYTPTSRSLHRSISSSTRSSGSRGSQTARCEPDVAAPNLHVGSKALLERPDQRVAARPVPPQHAPDVPVVLAGRHQLADRPLQEDRAASIADPLARDDCRQAPSAAARGSRAAAMETATWRACRNR